MLRRPLLTEVGQRIGEDAEAIADRWKGRVALAGQFLDVPGKAALR